MKEKVYTGGEEEWDDPRRQKFFDFSDPRANLAAFARGFVWKFYATWTWRTPRKDPLALEQTIRRKLAALPPMLQPSIVLVGIEGHKSGFLHAHALIGESVMSRTWRQWKEWAYHEFGISRVYPYDPEKGAIWYLSKYILKRGVDGDWFIWQKGD